MVLLEQGQLGLPVLPARNVALNQYPTEFVDQLPAAVALGNLHAHPPHCLSEFPHYLFHPFGFVHLLQLGIDGAQPLLQFNHLGVLLVDILRNLSLPQLL